jgi:purine-binding chemotaxis protein CheW
VLEIVPIPQIVKLEETPVYVVGEVNLHGRIVPIVDMNLRFGYPPEDYRLTDCIVFLERQGKTIGLLVNETLVVEDFNEGDFVPMSDYGANVEEAASESAPRFVLGVTTSGKRMVMALEVENLLNLSQSLANRNSGVQSHHANSSTLSQLNYTSQETAIIRERTIKLGQVAESDELTASIPHAVVRLGEEFFGVELGVIREFAEVHDLTPIPCCPEHIIGQINLRGDLFTIIDASKALGLPPIKESENRTLVIVNDTKLAVGIVVDELLGVADVNIGDLSPSLRGTGVQDRAYYRGSVSHGARTLSLIDLEALLRQGSLIVNEKPS